MRIKLRKFFRLAEEKAARFLMLASTLLVVSVLFSIIGSILIKGLPSVNWEILTSVPKGGYFFGKEGGIANAIIGSVYLAFGATLLSLSISLPVALFINTVLIKYGKLVHGTRFLLDLLWGVPSIVYGALGFVLMINLGLRTSLLAGIIVVAVFITPIMIRAMDEIFKTTPRGLMESSLSLGSTLYETGYRIMLKKGLPGVVTAVLLAFGRAIGDAASVLFTAGFTDNIPHSVLQPTATLPLAIFFQLGSPIVEVQNRAYASAFVLTVIILIISILARIIAGRHKY